MDFKKYNAQVEDFYDFNNHEIIMTLSLTGGDIPLIAGFNIDRDDLPTMPLKGHLMSIYLQAMADPSARFEIYKSESDFNKVHENVAPESIFPEWENMPDGSVQYVEFANINGTVLDVNEYDEDNWLVKLSSQGFEISTLIPKDMPALNKNHNSACASDAGSLFIDISPEFSEDSAVYYTNFNAPALGDIISGEFLLLFDLNSPE